MYMYFCIISLMNIAGIFFLAILENRVIILRQITGTLTRLCREKTARVTECVEHKNVLKEIILESIEIKGKLAVIWLYRINANGSKPHKLVHLTVQRYHIPDILDRIRVLLMSYYDGESQNSTS